MYKNKLSFQHLIIIALLIISFSYSCKKDKDEDKIPEDVLTTNKWIFETMNAYYLWNDKIPDINYEEEPDPEKYFDKLLYKKLDHWSYITSEYTTLNNELSGNSITMGYEPAFYMNYDGESIFIVVNYVFPGSSADEAGLKRGDIIVKINNTTLDTSNYFTLFSKTEYTAELGTLFSYAVIPSGKTIKLKAKPTITNPIVYHDVLDVNDSKIGYLVYVGFISGQSNEFNDELDSVFAGFKKDSIEELILDLRYNLGGDLDAAIHLASLIAPSMVVSQEATIIKMVYNDSLQYFIKHYESNPDEYFLMTFSKVEENLGLGKVYILSTGLTASASELVIIGLDPYMEVIQIGESTYGKYAAAWVIPDDNEEWAIMPVVSKYANADDYTDFINGLMPDYYVKDNVIEAGPFGSTTDPMLNKAIYLATGKYLKSASVSEFEYKQIIPKEMEYKRNLFVPYIK